MIFLSSAADGKQHDDVELIWGMSRQVEPTEGAESLEELNMIC
jgi:hypothetical protein